MSNLKKKIKKWNIQKLMSTVFPFSAMGTSKHSDPTWHQDSIHNLPSYIITCVGHISMN